MKTIKSAFAALVSGPREAVVVLLVLAVPALIVWACIAIIQKEKRNSPAGLITALLIVLGVFFVLIGVAYAGCSLMSGH
jgi:hypothetical protein